MRTFAIRIHERGGHVEVMRWEEVETGEPGPGKVSARNAGRPASISSIPAIAAGSEQKRTTKTPLPMVLGTEGARRR